MTEVATVAKIRETKLVPVDSLVRFPGNAKRGDVATIQDSLRLNGQYRPLVVWKHNNWILAGNHTFDAAVAEGWKKVSVTFVECDERTARRINLVDNRSAELGGYDPEALVKLVGELPSLEGTGWTAEALQAELTKLPAPELPGTTPESPGNGDGGGYQAQHGIILVCVDQKQQEFVYGEIQGLLAGESAFDGVEVKLVSV